VVSQHEDACTVILPEPGEFTPPEVDEDRVDLCQKFSQGLQVIVKMTNIELTPEIPSYKGEPWCLDGQLVSSILQVGLTSEANFPRTNISVRQLCTAMTVKM
jgi:hypothetical protein